MINIAVLIGRIGQDVELRSTQSGKSVCSFEIACQRRGKSDCTDWITIICWEKTAEFVCKYFSKGSAIAIEGSIQTRTYEDKNGNKRKAVEVVANQVHFAESKQKGSDSGGQTTLSGGADEDIPDEDDLPF